MSTRIGEWVVERRPDRTKRTQRMTNGCQGHRLALVYKRLGSRHTLVFFSLARVGPPGKEFFLGADVPNYGPHEQWRRAVYRKMERAGLRPCNEVMLQVELDKYRKQPEGVVRMRMEALAARLNDLYTI